MTWKFEPKQDITAYELALLRVRAGDDFYAYDEDMEGDGESSVPKPVRRHFRKLPTDAPRSRADAAHRERQLKDGEEDFIERCMGWMGGRFRLKDAKTP